ncbi:MAG: hypothetical protein ACREM3_09520 [Candidatus Rokuibacteriota bacterium]
MIDSHALATLGLRPTRLFEGFPYLVTRVVPSMYHVILIPDDLRAEDLVESARRQAQANHLRTCLVRQTDSALYIGPDGRESWTDSPPTGGIIVTDRLQPHRTFLHNHALTARRLALERFAREASPRQGYMFGDLTKGGRKPALEEEVRLAGTQSTGVPRGLDRCARCGEWQGRCLDPSPQFAGLVMDVHCRCANDNRCAACGALLHDRKLNANYYDEADGHIWHVPGFSAFGHTCL